MTCPCVQAQALCVRVLFALAVEFVVVFEGDALCCAVSIVPTGHRYLLYVCLCVCVNNARGQHVRPSSTTDPFGVGGRGCLVLFAGVLVCAQALLPACVPHATYALDCAGHCVSGVVVPCFVGHARRLLSARHCWFWTVHACLHASLFLCAWASSKPATISPL